MYLVQCVTPTIPKKNLFIIKNNIINVIYSIFI